MGEAVSKEFTIAATNPALEVENQRSLKTQFKTIHAAEDSFWRRCKSLVDDKTATIDIRNYHNVLVTWKISLEVEQGPRPTKLAEEKLEEFDTNNPGDGSKTERRGDAE